MLPSKIFYLILVLQLSCNAAIKNLQNCKRAFYKFSSQHTLHISKSLCHLYLQPFLSSDCNLVVEQFSQQPRACIQVKKLNTCIFMAHFSIAKRHILFLFFKHFKKKDAKNFTEQHTQTKGKCKHYRKFLELSSTKKCFVNLQFKPKHFGRQSKAYET